MKQKLKNNEEGFYSITKLDPGTKTNEKPRHNESRNGTYRSFYWINLSKWLVKQNMDVVTVNLTRSKETNKKIVIIRNPKVIKKMPLSSLVKNGYYTFVRST